VELTLNGPAGRLEALLEPATGAAPRFASVVCHPHPAYGGTLRNTVVHRTARSLRDAGGTTLRFNFRGVGGSAGAYDGRAGPGGEEDDAACALDYLAAELPGLPLWGAGFSFGARTIAGLALRDPRLQRLVLVAPPVNLFDGDAVAHSRVPAFAVWGDRDEFGTLSAFEERYPDATERLETLSIEGTDHFFRGRTPQLEEAIREYARRAVETA
jgi:alpha/beta superfamily hydrolase